MNKINEDMSVSKSNSSLLLPTESIDKLIFKVLDSPKWLKAQQDFNDSKTIYIIGNGGNLAVADHGSVDITRLSKKLAIAPGSGIVATSVIGDSSIDTWFLNWLKAHLDVQSDTEKSKSMIIGISSSGTAKNICSCLSYAQSQSLKTLMISARELNDINHPFNCVELGTDYYHTGEVISLFLFYQLIHGSGSECPSISQKVGKPSFDRLINV